MPQGPYLVAKKAEMHEDLPATKAEKELFEDSYPNNHVWCEILSKEFSCGGKKQVFLEGPEKWCDSGRRQHGNATSYKRRAFSLETGKLRGDYWNVQ